MFDLSAIGKFIIRQFHIVQYSSKIASSSPEQVQENSDNYTQHKTGNNREVKNEMPFPDKDIPGQSAQKRDPASKGDEDSGCHQQDSCCNYEFSYGG